MLIRFATSADAEMLADLSFKTFWDAFIDHPRNAREDMDAYMSAAFNVEQIRRELEDPNAVFLIAESEEKPAGYAKLQFGSIEEPVVAERPVELCRLYSTAEKIGKGVGQALMDRCLEIGRERGSDVMWLGVWEFNPRAQRFYEKQGFRIVGEHVFQLGSDAQTDHLMQFDLNRS